VTNLCKSLLKFPGDSEVDCQPEETEAGPSGHAADSAESADREVGEGQNDSEAHRAEGAAGNDQESAGGHRDNQKRPGAPDSRGPGHRRSSSQAKNAAPAQKDQGGGNN